MELVKSDGRIKGEVLLPTGITGIFKWNEKILDLKAAKTILIFINFLSLKKLWNSPIKCFLDPAGIENRQLRKLEVYKILIELNKQFIRCDVTLVEKIADQGFYNYFHGL